MFHRFSFIAILILSSSVLASVPRKIYVPDDYRWIQDAVNNASSRDYVIVRDGIYTGDRNTDITCSRNVTIKSENGPLNCIIYCGGSASNPHRGFDGYVGDIEGFTIRNGYVTGSGGGLRNVGRVSRCIIKNNIALESGGGIYGFDELLYSEVSGNIAKIGGGATCISSLSYISDSTIVDNYATEFGGGVANQYSGIQVYGSIIYYNSPSNFSGTILGSNPTVYALESCLQDFQANLNCTVVDWLNVFDEIPNFADRANGDYRLTENSPCVDVAYETDAKDILGLPRPIGLRRDIGAYEFWFYGDVNYDGGVNNIDIALWNNNSDVIFPGMNLSLYGDEITNESEFLLLCNNWLNTIDDCNGREFYHDFEKADGGLVYDKSCAEHNGVLFGGAEIIYDEILKSNVLSLDGVDDYFVLNGYKGVLGNTGRNFYAKIRPTSMNGVIASWGVDGVGTKFEIKIVDGSLRVSIGGSSFNGRNFGFVCDGEWHTIHFIIPKVYDATLYDMYMKVDSFDLLSNTTEIYNPNQLINTIEGEDFLIGRSFDNDNPQFYQGEIEDICLASNFSYFFEMTTPEHLRVHWDFEEIFDTIVKDSSVQRYHGTMQGGIEVVNDTERAGNVLHFDGIDGCVVAEGYKGFSTYGTVSCWIKPENSGQIIGWGAVVYEGSKWVCSLVDGDDGELYLKLDVHEGNTIGATDLNDGNWHHIAVVVDYGHTSRVKLYVDGKPEEYSSCLYSEIETITSSRYSPPDLAVGCYLSSPDYYKGYIDDIRVYNDELTDRQVTHLYELTK